MESINNGNAAANKALVKSLILASISISVVSSVAVGSPNPKDDWTKCCGVGYGQSASIITPGTSKTADMLNRYLNGDWSKGYMGIIQRSIDGNHPGSFDGLLQAGYVHKSMKAPNSIYQSYNPKAPSTGYCKPGDRINDPTDHWFYANVAAAVATRWSMNSKSDEYQGHSGEVVKVDAYYWSDSNSLDKRNKNGRGCHPYQNYACTDKEGCITLDEYNCKCNYDGIAPREYGNQIAKSYQSQYNPHGIGLKAQSCGMDNKQPMHAIRDFSSCWFEESDFSAANNHMSMFIDAQNTAWSARNEVFNGLSPETGVNYNIGEGYWGWNEITATENIDAKASEVTDAIIVGLPAMDIKIYPDTDNNNLCGLCMMTVDALNQLSKDIAKQQQLVGDKPVVIMENVRGKMSKDECKFLWGATDCDSGFRKEIFAQNFLFKDGSCLIYNEDAYKKYGTADVYYRGANDPACTSHWPPASDPWWNNQPRCNN